VSVAITLTELFLLLFVKNGSWSSHYRRRLKYVVIYVMLED
jgi:hypothetical protein